MNKRFWQRGVALGTAATMVAGLAACGDTNPKNSAADGTGLSSTAEKPNVVYIVLDDVGFGDLGCYGSSINTPNMDMLAQNGIQYTNYMTSPMSSPSRASMLTGFESNFVGMGTVADISLGDVVPNMTGSVRPECGFITHSLQENGYEAMALGKWHLASYDNFMPEGDHSEWPQQHGFDKNYNYVGSQTNQFSPGGMIEGDEYVVPDTSDPDYHLTSDLFNKTLEYIDETPDDEPFFAYVALGAMHGPFNVTQEYIDKYDGVFDEGWDVEREKIFARQKELGIFPEDAEMPKGSDKVPAWDSLTDMEKEVARKHMEVYAGFLEHTDAQLGKFLDELKERGEYDNTMFVLVSDNGANSNGGAQGSFAHDAENIYQRTIEEQYALLDQFGSEQYGTQYNSGWAMASNTPFQHFKTNAHYGGIRTTCIVSWANGIQEPGRLCSDLITVSDIAPTVLEVTGTERLTQVNGVDQLEMQGISFADTFASSGPRENPRTSYSLMMFKDRCYTNDGYTIVTNPKTSEWELYGAVNDPTQMHNLAAEKPEIVEKLAKEFETVQAEDMNARNLLIDIVQGVEPEKLVELYGTPAQELLAYMQNGTMPTSAEALQCLQIIQAATFVPEGGGGYAGVGTSWYRSPDNPQSAKDYVYKIEDGPFYALAGAPTVNVSYTISTQIETDGKDEGVIYANGGVDGGYVIYMKDGKLVYENNYVGNRQKLVSSKPVPSGTVDVEVEYQKKNYYSGTAILKMNGEEVARQDIKHLSIFVSYDYTSIGADVGSKVSNDYTDDFEFTGSVSEVKVHLGDDLWK